MDYKKNIRGKAIDTRQKAVWYNAYVLKYFEKVFLYLMGSGIDFPLSMSLREAEGDEAIHSRAEDQKSSSSHFAARNSGKATIPKPELRATGYFFYTSREFDFEIGLQFNRNRYYSPQLGRFTSKDLIINRNLFFYGKSNPVRFRDVLGLYGNFIPGMWEGKEAFNYLITGCSRDYKECIDECRKNWGSEIDECIKIIRDCMKDCPKDDIEKWKKCVKDCAELASVCNKLKAGEIECLYGCIDNYINCMMGAADASWK